MSTELKVGDQVAEQFGPYRAVATVVEVTDRGAVLEFPSSAVFTGFPQATFAPDGTQLTHDRTHGFLGRAHWSTAEVIRS